MKLYYSNDKYDLRVYKIKENYWSIQNSNGEELRKCRTLKESINRIETQRV